MNTQKLKLGPKRTVVSNVGANHGDFSLLHREMLQHFGQWVDEFCERQHGFKLSELQAQEQWLARLMAINDPGPEAIAERDKCLETYRKVWLPRRKLLDGL